MIFLDILLLIMIIICVSYCWMLSRRIQDLQNSRVEFARMIKELNVSIVKAENNVNEMSQLSKVTSNEIKAVVEEAKEISGELSSINARAVDLSENLHKQVQYSARYLNIDDRQEVDYSSVLSSKPREKFTQEDLAPLKEESVSYTHSLKNFLHNITTERTNETSSSSNQINYYDTLRKINARK